jgi:hypothetical protein
VIGKVTRGRSVFGLLRYLYGPGRRNEHTDPHLVAGWDDPTTLEPSVVNGRPEVRPLGRLLDQPLKAVIGSCDARPVWQCSLRTAPQDRVLSDAEWATVARDVVTRAGFTTGDVDAGGCRWVAVRHAADHIHLVVTLATEEGRPVWPRNDFYRVGEACRAAEERFELRRTAARDRTAGRAASYGESEKAARHGLREPARVTLRRSVRTAAATATGIDDFLDRLRGAGLLVRERYSERTPGELTGYAVALPDPGGRTADGAPVWYGGGRLAADLSLPKLRSRWDTERPAVPQRGGRSPLSVAERQAVWQHAQRTAAAATADIRRLAGTDSAAAADAAWAASDTLTAAARLVEGTRGGPLTRAADAYARAARQPWGRIPPPAPTGSALRGLARSLAPLGRARADETTQLLALVTALIALTEAVAELRRAQDRAAQAAAARAAAEQLRGLGHRPAAARDTTWRRAVVTARTPLPRQRR